MAIDVLSKEGTKVSSIELNQDVFGIEPNQHVLFEAVHLQRASLRQGTHAVKTAQLYAAAEESRLNKKEQVTHVKVQSVHRSSAEAALYSDRLQDHTASACRRK